MLQLLLVTKQEAMEPPLTPRAIAHQFPLLSVCYQHCAGDHQALLMYVFIPVTRFLKGVQLVSEENSFKFNSCKLWIPDFKTKVFLWKIIFLLL